MTKRQLIDRLANLADDAEIFLDGGTFGNDPSDLVHIHHVAIYQADQPAFAILETFALETEH